jgi:predicted nucleic acid-binding protein
MIIDTMVVAYALLGVPTFGPESAEALRKADDLLAPASVEAELLNVVWQWGRRQVAPEQAKALYENSLRLWTELIPVKPLWTLALELALTTSHSPYDTLFIAAARKRRTQVLTYDEKMLNIFPEDAIRVHDFLDS